MRDTVRMASLAFTIAAITLAAFHASTWAWVLCVIAAVVSVAGEMAS
jgi:hypothetical protein